MCTAGLKAEDMQVLFSAGWKLRSFLRNNATKNERVGTQCFHAAPGATMETLQNRRKERRNMPQGQPLPGEKYKHFKDKLYQIIAVAQHSETGERLVVYQALYGDFQVYVRPYDMFVSEVDHWKYPQVSQQFRFEYLGGEVPALGSAEAVQTEEETPPLSGVEGQAAHAVESAEVSSASSGQSVCCGQSAGMQPAQNRAEAEGNTESGQSAFVAGRPEHSSQSAAEAPAEPEGVISPWLEKILDADTFDEKYQIVCDMRIEVTDRLIDDIAVVLDLAIPEGNLIDRYDQLKYCMRTRLRYENKRLR